MIWLVRPKLFIKPFSLNWLFLLLTFYTPLAFSDYAWLPREGNLLVKLGADYFRTLENFSSDGAKVNIRSLGSDIELKEYRFYLESEYSFIQDWSVYMRAQFVSGITESATTSSGSILTSSSIGDLNLGLKWSLLSSSSPLLTLETSFKIPPYSTSNVAADELVVGDGVFNWETRLHTGYRFNKNFAGCLSPGILARFGGYDTALLLGGMLSASFNPVYLRLLVNWSYSLSKPVTTTAVTSNSARGSGGSFTHLSLHPDLFSLGGRIGVFVSKDYRIEAYIEQALSGKSAPQYLKAGLYLVADFNFHKEPPKKTKLKEIPFDSNQEEMAPIKKPEPEVD